MKDKLNPIRITPTHVDPIQLQNIYHHYLNSLDRFITWRDFMGLSFSLELYNLIYGVELVYIILLLVQKDPIILKSLPLSLSLSSLALSLCGMCLGGNIIAM